MSTPNAPVPVGVVAIGRNEGQRLKDCLRSILSQLPPHHAARVVYVDSASSDGSPDFARSLGVDVVELDMSIPFTAARARNAGAARLTQRFPDTAAIQFLDGDCILEPDWLAHGVEELASDPRLGVVCGTRRERHRDASIYNRLCDIELDVSLGDATWFGGDALIRRAAFDAAGGYNPAIIAGEEPELASRLRALGWSIRVVDHPMSNHDAAMTRFSQWWKRARRNGHAMAEGAFRYDDARGYSKRRVLTTLALGLGLPALALAGTTVLGVWSLAVFLMYDLLWLKIFAGSLSRGRSPSDSALYALFLVLAKLPESLGILRYFRNRLTGRRSTIIEHKAAASGATG
jgi:GT2 family glycosyltransferase